MSKYRLLRERIEASPLAHQHTLRSPEAVDDQMLRLAHDAGYITRVVQGSLEPKQVRKIGFPWSPALVERSRRSSGATLAACRAALSDGAGVNLAGGTHHAFRDQGQGFCVFNDSAIAARVLQQEGLIKQAIIIDCDVHQGNGTASILRDDPTIFTFSIHGAKNFPFHKEQSDLDIGLPDGTTDAPYLKALQEGLMSALRKASADIAIYLAGADPYEGDRLGRMKLTKEGLYQRDEAVLTACRQAGLPVAVAMAGGYAPQVSDIVDIHFQTVSLAATYTP